MYLSNVSKMLGKAEFEAQLEAYGMRKTDYYKDGTRLWRKSDGQIVSVPEYDEYPDYVLTKLLKEAGLFYIPLYTSNL
jgi:hypothetical protein